VNLNNLSGKVGIGTTFPLAKLGIRDGGFQLRVVNKIQPSNEWYIGASHSDWNIGGNSFAISPSSASGNAMLVLNAQNNTISSRSNRIIGVGDPINSRDAVNLRTLNAASFIAPKEVSNAASNATFAGCAGLCRSKNDGGHTDWTIPSVAQASHFIGIVGSEQFIWTSDIEMYSYATATDPQQIIIPNTSTRRLKIDMHNGDIESSSANNVISLGICRCVR